MKRLPRPVVLFAVGFAVFTLGGLVQFRMDSGTRSLVPAGDASYKELEASARSFGGDPVILLLQSKNPRELVAGSDNLLKLGALEGRLANLPDVAAVYGPATVVNQIAGATQDLLAQISGARDAQRNVAIEKARAAGFSEAAADAAGNAAIVDFDRRYGSLVSLGLPAGLPTLRNPRFAQYVLFGERGEPKSEWKSVLPADDTVAVLVRPREELDQVGNAALIKKIRTAVKQSQVGVVRTTITGVPVVTAELSNQARREMPFLGGLAAITVGLVFVCVPWARSRLFRARPLLIALSSTAVTVAAFGWIGRPVSIGVVAFMPILLGIASNIPFYVSSLGRQRRVAVVGFAAAAGYSSLLLSPMPFVRELGAALALGMLVTVAFAYAVGGWLDYSGDPAREAFVQLPLARPTAGRLAALVGAGLVAAVGWAVFPHLKVETRPDELAKGLSVMSDVRHAEDVLGSSGEISLVLTGNDVLSPAALQWSDRAQTRLVNGYGDQLRPIVTVSNLLRFLGSEPTASQIDAGVNLMPSYLTSAVVTPDRTKSAAVFGVRFNSIAEQRALLAKVQRLVSDAPPGYRAQFVGLPVVAVHGFDLVTAKRLTINLVGIAGALLVLWVGLRRARDVVVAGLAVVFATGWVLAGTMLLGGTVSPLTLAIGSFTIATACEFAVMRPASYGARRPAWAGIRTPALAAVLGYLTLAASALAVMRDFGVMLAVSVASSYGAAILVSWATTSPEARAADAGRQNQRAAIGGTS